MRAVVFILVAALSAGCSNTVVAVGGGNPVPPVSGTVITSGASGLTVVSTSGAAALALVLTFGVMDYINNPQPFPSPSTLLSPGPAPAPELAANRRINEQDCTKPIDITLGNLRCK